MKYTEYFTYRIRNSKEINITPQEMYRLLEIVKLESAILGASEMGVNLDKDRYRYRRSKTLNELTQRKTPQLLYKEIVGW